MFVTLFYAQLDPAEGCIAYVNAGHNPPLFYHRSLSGTGSLSRLGRTGMALGVFVENDYQEHRLKFAPGDI
jgi:sigma-B regulation protein RsbU (phosphoserine phosphatase)